MKFRLSTLILLYTLGVLLLFANDWFWKAAYPGWLTGKLSDFLGLLLLPVFLAVVFPRVRRFFPALIGLGFIYWKTPLADGFIDFWNQYCFTVSRTVDYTDYVALVVLPLAYHLIKRPNFLKLRLALSRAGWRPALMALTIGSIFVFSSTSRDRPNYPPGDILINEYFQSPLSEAVILEKIAAMGYVVQLDSLYGDTLWHRNYPYYTIHQLSLPARAPAVIEQLNFTLYQNSDSTTSIRLINIEVAHDWELQDWRILKQETKYYKKLLQAQFLIKLE